MEESMDRNCPRKLDLNLPLLSTRRLGSYNGAGISRDTNQRIPFCWEEAPGKPKETGRNDGGDEDTPRPRLPPGRWRRQKEVKKDQDGNHAVNVHGDDDGCDADVDNDNEDEKDDDMFSDALDVLSLTEAIDIAQKKAEDDDHEHDHGLDKLNLESAEFMTDSHQSPNFMIERFLPDATALAASSSAAFCASRNLSKRFPYSCDYEGYYSPTLGTSNSSQKPGCGLENFLPWRLKHKFCGVKNPNCIISPRKLQHECSSKQKKHTSSPRPFRVVNKDI